MATEDYRERAETLRKEASLAENGEIREQLLLLAAEWDQLAEMARAAGPEAPPE